MMLAYFGGRSVEMIFEMGMNGPRHKVEQELVVLSGAKADPYSR